MEYEFISFKLNYQKAIKGAYGPSKERAQQICETS